MVFGNMGGESATGVAFTRDPATGEKVFYGEFLLNAQGEDVVAGIRTPQPISIKGKGSSKLPAMEETLPTVCKQLDQICKRLEKHFGEMQDIEFTVQQGTLWMLQTRKGKRTAFAALKIAVDMVEEGLINKATAVSRVEPDSLNQLLAPIFDPKAKDAAVKEGRLLAKGLNAGPGAACGKAVFTPERAMESGGAGPEDHPHPHRDLTRGHSRDACGQGHSDLPRRHDVSRGPGGPRNGQALRRRLLSAEHHLRDGVDGGQGQDDSRGRLRVDRRDDGRGSRRRAGDQFVGDHPGPDREED